MAVAMTVAVATSFGTSVVAAAAHHSTKPRDQPLRRVALFLATNASSE